MLSVRCSKESEIQAAGSRRLDGDEQLTSGRFAGETGGRVDDVAERREVPDGATGPGRTHERVPGVHGRADGDGPALARIRRARRARAGATGLDRGRRVSGPADAAEEEADGLVADELVDQAVVGQDGAPRRAGRSDRGMRGTRWGSIARRCPWSHGCRRTAGSPGSRRRRPRAVQVLDAGAADRRIAGKRANPTCRSTAPPGPRTARRTSCSWARAARAA